MQDVPDRSNSENYDPMESAGSLEQRKESLAKAHSSPTRAPLTILGNTTSQGRSVNVSPHKPKHDPQESFGGSPSPCDVGPNAKRWAASVRKKQSSGTPASGTVVVKEQGSEIKEDAAWNHWLENGDSTITSSKAYSSSVVTLPDESQAGGKHHTDSLAVSSPGFTPRESFAEHLPSASLAPDPDTPPKQAETSVEDPVKESKAEEPIQNSETSIATHRATSNLSKSVLRKRTSHTGEHGNTQLETIFSESSASPTVATSYPELQSVSNAEETDKEADMPVQYEEADKVPSLPHKGYGGYGHVRAPSHHRRQSSIIGGPVYLRSSHRAKIPSADIGALKLHEYFSPLSLGHTSSGRPLEMLMTHPSDASNCDSYMTSSETCAGGYEYGMYPEDGAMNIPVSRTLSSSPTESAKDTSGDVSSRSRASPRSTGYSAHDESALTGEPLSARKPAFVSRPYRPLSAEGQKPAPVAIPDSPDPFKKGGVSTLNPNEPTYPVHRGGDAHLHPSHIQRTISADSPVLWKERARRISYDSPNTSPDQRAKHLGLPLSQCPQSAPGIVSGRSNLVGRISRLAESCVGRLPKSPPLQSQNSFTPLSDSMATQNWTQMLEEHSSLGIDSSSYSHGPLENQHTEDNRPMSHRTALQSPISTARSKYSAGKFSHGRSDSVMPLESKLAKAGVRFDADTQDDVIKAVHRTLHEKLA